VDIEPAGSVATEAAGLGKPALAAALLPAGGEADGGGIDPAQVWTGLEIASHEVTGPDTATVSFTARWKQNGRKGRLTETSRFRRDGAGWLYVDGDTG
ncbi:MAG: YchJ family metal-binding protein, partial [Pseudomonadota bacterium]